MVFQIEDIDKTDHSEKVIKNLIEKLIIKAKEFNVCCDAESNSDSIYYQGWVRGLLFAIKQIDKNANIRLVYQYTQTGFNYKSVEVYGEEYTIENDI